MTDTKTIAWKGRTGPFDVVLTPGVFAPTTTSTTLAEALEIKQGDTVLDIGSGSGVLSFVAARLGAGKVVGVDLSQESVDTANANARALGLDDRVEFRAGSLFEPVSDVRADVVIGDVSGVPDELGKLAGWFPPGTQAGGPTGAELPVRMVEEVGDCLVPGGRMYLPTGTIQDENIIVEAARRVFGAANMESILERDLPLPALVAKSKELAKLVQQGVVNLHQRGSRMLWQLHIWRLIRPDAHAPGGTPGSN